MAALRAQHVELKGAVGTTAGLRRSLSYTRWAQFSAQLIARDRSRRWSLRRVAIWEAARTHMMHRNALVAQAREAREQCSAKEQEIAQVRTEAAAGRALLAQAQASMVPREVAAESALRADAARQCPL